MSDTKTQGKPYYVAVDSNGCERCGHGKSYAVCHIDATGEECQESVTFEDEDDAQSLCNALNRAYERGMAAGGGQ